MDKLVNLHAHAMERLVERVATEAEVLLTVQSGKRFPVKYGGNVKVLGVKFPGGHKGKPLTND